MSLQQKVSVTLLSVTAVLALLSYVILNAVISPAFDDLEVQSAKTNLVRVDRAIDAELDNLIRISADWAPWDDSYQYVQGKYPAFEKSNLATTVLIDLHVNLMIFYDASGDVRWERLLVGGEVEELSSIGVFGFGAATEAKLNRHESVSSKYSGILQTKRGPMLITSDPILTTSRSGPISGTLILGRFLDSAMMTKLRRRTEVDIDWHSLDQHSDIHSLDAIQLLDSGVGAINVVVNDDVIDTRSLLYDINDEPILVLHASTPRSISALGDRALTAAFLFLGIAAVIVTMVIWLMLRNIIVRPLESLAGHITNVRKSGDLSKRLHIDRRDEIAAVAREFDEMTVELEDARKLLLDQSFKAGKADTAAEVMHNIRNAMTPVINGIDRLGVVCSVTNGLKVAQATAQLADPDCPAGRKEKLIQYIDSAFKHVEDSHEIGRGELAAVSTQARQVEAILSDQERHAQVSPVIECLELDEVLDEAILVIPKRKSPEIKIDVQGGIGRFRVQGHRVGLMQVLGNLVLNAYESIARSESTSGRISLSASKETVDDREMVRLVVGDTGCGFDEARRQKIFQRGFSSKSGNLSGLGLHWCANALAAMGGRIQAKSTGAGQGAEFHVLLPAAHGA